MAKLAIITGGATGIGRHLVTAFVDAGYAVAFTFFKDSIEADQLIMTLGRRGAKVEAFACDQRQSSEVMSFYNRAFAWAGQEPDVLVNNAGVQTWSPLLELSEEDWDNVIRTNLTGCFLHTKEAARRMVAAGKGGAIINIGSGCNKLAFPKLVDYTASKGGIEQFTKASAIELGPNGIRVNCVAPGAIETERTKAEAPEYAETWGRVTPLRRVGTPEDIAGPVLFLASDAASFVTGQTLWVDGGVFSQAFWPYAL